MTPGPYACFTSPAVLGRPQNTTEFTRKHLLDPRSLLVALAFSIGRLPRQHRKTASKRISGLPINPVLVTALYRASGFADCPKP